MKIQVTFESLEEFYQTFQGYNEDGSLRLRRTPPEAAEAPVEATEAPEQGEPPKKKGGRTQEECRALLYKLNKKTGSNIAKEIIKAHGGVKLTDITDPDELAAIYKEAEEALNGE